jgi:mono/diheme cytochrome c family protein
VRILRHAGIAPSIAAFAVSAIFTGVALAQDASKATLERGRHLVLIGHCNNCHTAGYAALNGKVSEPQWLMGNPVGWRGKNGTTYAPNLRIFVANLSEADWTRLMRTVEWRPPMPWWSVREHSDDELAAMYHYIRSLKPLGKPAPSFLPPDTVPPRPYQQLPDMSSP